MKPNFPTVTMDEQIYPDTTQLSTNIVSLMWLLASPIFTAKSTIYAWTSSCSFPIIIMALRVPACLDVLTEYPGLAESRPPATGHSVAMCSSQLLYCIEVPVENLLYHP